MKISLKRGDITKETVDAIIVSTNALGYMNGEIARQIKSIGGKEIESEAHKKAPIALGSAILTKAGSLPCKAIIHTPIMDGFTSLTSVENIQKAVEAALKVADQNNFEKVSIPGIGTGSGGISRRNIARTMITAIQNVSTAHLKEVMIIDSDSLLMSEFEKVL